MAALLETLVTERKGENPAAITLLYAVYGLVLGVSKIVAAQRGITVESDRRLQEEMGADSRWTRLFWLATGLDEGTARMRGLAALSLYVETSPPAG